MPLPTAALDVHFDLLRFLGLPSVPPPRYPEGVLMQLIMTPPHHQQYKPGTVPATTSTRWQRLVKEAVLSVRLLRLHTKSPLMMPLALCSTNATWAVLSHANVADLWDLHVPFDAAKASAMLEQRRATPRSMLVQEAKIRIDVHVVHWAWKICTFLLSPFSQTLYIDTDVIVLSPTFIVDMLYNALRVGDMVLPIDPMRPGLGTPIKSRQGAFVLNPPMYGRGIPPLCAGIMAYRLTNATSRLLQRGALALINVTYPTDRTDARYMMRQGDQEMFWAELSFGAIDRELHLLLLPEEYYCPAIKNVQAGRRPVWTTSHGAYPCHALHHHYTAKQLQKANWSQHLPDHLPHQCIAALADPTRIDRCSEKLLAASRTVAAAAPAASPRATPSLPRPSRPGNAHRPEVNLEALKRVSHV